MEQQIKTAVEYKRAWREKNRAKVRAYSREYAKKRRREKPEQVKRYYDNWRKKNPQKTKELQWKYDIKRKFGVFPETYAVMLLSQEGVCAICKRPQSEFRKKFAVDHNHETGVIRGLLCSMCNLLISHSQEEKTILQAAIVYLEIWNTPKKK